MGCSAAASYYWWPCAINSQSGGRRRCPLSPHMEAVIGTSAECHANCSGAANGDEQKVQGSNGYCSHTAGLSTEAEVCNETIHDCHTKEFSFHTFSNSRLLVEFSWNLHCRPARSAVMQWIFDRGRLLRPIYSLDMFSLVSFSRGDMTRAFNRRPPRCFWVGHQQTKTFTTNVKRLQSTLNQK